MGRLRWGCVSLTLFGCSSPASVGLGDGSMTAAVEPSARDAGAVEEALGEEPADDAAPLLEASTEASICDRTLPTCPASPPSYQRDVAPIILRECSACHYPGSTIAKGVFSTYQELQAGRGSVLDEVYACKMPVAPVSPLTPADRTTLLTWIECGGPNN
jgi:hypothetical protein